MGNIGKSFSILLILTLVVSCLMLAKPAFAQSIPKPSIPQFSVSLYDSSYDIPASTTTNPYNGQQTMQPARHVEARTLVFTIQNQAFTPFQILDANNNIKNVGLHYNIRYKGHFDQTQGWNVLFGPNFGYIEPASGPQTVYNSNVSISSQYFDVIQWSVEFPSDAQVDFQVEALIGYANTPLVFIGQESGWSNTQTIVLNENVSALPSTLPQIFNSPILVPSTTSTTIANPTLLSTPTPTVPEFPSMIVLIFFTLFTLPTLLVFFKKTIAKFFCVRDFGFINPIS